MSGTSRPMQSQPAGASRLSPGATSGKAQMLVSPSSIKGAGWGSLEVFAEEPFGNLDELRGQHRVGVERASILPTLCPHEHRK